ncbi:hypothetical protein AERO8C_70645 [Aeromonas veronii]|uniref:Uncharacterized protein n=1 Tax=Aeromonas veronii TaxID=654 RepID=A0A653LBT3_AERVE|nr:hypothetical protein AERO8C_70645 [Aeromonas veronii]
MRQEGVTDIDLLQGIALDQTADTEAGTVLLALHQIEPVTIAGITDRRPLLDILLRLLQGANAPIADVAIKVAVIEQLKDEGGIGGDHFAQDQAGGGNHGKGSQTESEGQRVPRHSRAGKPVAPSAMKKGPRWPLMRWDKRAQAASNPA